MRQTLKRAEHLRAGNSPKVELIASMDASSAEELRGRSVAIGLMFAALFCFACLDTSGKWMSRHIPIWEVVWARYMGATLFVFIFVNPATTPSMLSTARPGLQLIRSLLLFGATVLNFFALRWLQLAQNVSIAFAGPLLIALFAGPILGEWVGPRRLAAIIVGFLGVIVVTRPSLAGIHPAMLLSFGATTCNCFYSILTRVLAASDSSRTTTFFSAVSGAVILTPALPFFWVTPPDWKVWLFLVLIGGFGALGHWFLILAHHRAPAALLAPFGYTQIVWMIGFGYIVFGDLPDGWTLTGAGIVIASGLYLLYRSRVVKQATKTV
ncbi:MAG: DMT family transporter [Methylobacteriaceae bacterium]|nr:DMT family transporter [Methylobacteriaceae bacterium]MBV9396294.1 DMT family transporter [Methylobacteriaceae bacterium]